MQLNLIFKQQIYQLQLLTITRGSFVGTLVSNRRQKKLPSFKHEFHINFTDLGHPSVLFNSLPLIKIKLI